MSKIKCYRFDGIGEAYKAAVLSNGLQVRIVEKPGFLSKYAVFSVHYGGADMRFRLDGVTVDTPAGIAHYLEHKMFDMPDGDNSLSMLTANGADPNAYTSVDTTCYYFQCTDKFYENLEILLRFVTTPYFTEETVEKERGIIGQEIMMGLDDPDRTLYYNLMGMLYRNNPIREDIAGSVESISRITPQTLYDCHRTFYCPGNMVLSVEGDVKAEEVIAAAERVLSGWSASPVPKADYGESDGVLPYETYMRVKQPISEQQFLIGAKLIPSEGDYTRQQLAAKLALQVMLGPSSEFYTKLYSDGLINRSFLWDLDYAAGTAAVIIGGESRDPDAVMEAFRATVAKTSAEGLDPVRFERAKKAAIGGALRSFEEFDNVCIGMAEEVFFGYRLFDAPAVLASVTEEECRAFISEYLAPERLAVSIIEP